MRFAFAFLALLLVFFPLTPKGARAAGPNDGLAPDVSLDRATPKRSLEGFLRAGERGEYERAAHYLDLRALPKDRQPTEGVDLAQKLAYALSHKAHLDTTKLPDQAEAGAPVPPSTDLQVVAGTVYLDDDAIAITLARLKCDDGVYRWVLARSTVSMAKVLYDSLERSPWEDHVPRALQQYTLFGNDLWQWMVLLLAVPLAYATARLSVWAVLWVGKQLAKRTRTEADDILIASGRRPARLALTAALVVAAVEPLHMTVTVGRVVGHLVFSLYALSGTWFLLALISASVRWLTEQVPVGAEFDLTSRSARTRLALLERVASILVVLLGLAVGLMQFELVRSFGVSLLASAGLAGVVFGFAAQKSLAAIVAGVQLSVTQPIRIGDSVVVEGEFSTVLQINLTYVLLGVWDGRQMIVPVTYFLEKPFQNWTRTTPELLGTVTVTCDFTTPLEAVRTELERLCAASPLWDQRLCKLQVTDAGEFSMTLRALASARNASDCFDLRCSVREGLLGFLRELEGGRYLARRRQEVVKDTVGGRSPRVPPP